MRFRALLACGESCVFSGKWKIKSFSEEMLEGKVRVSLEKALTQRLYVKCHKIYLVCLAQYFSNTKATNFIS